MDAIFSVSEFVEFINEYLQQAGQVWVEGEISSIEISRNQWIFLTVKDDQSALSVFSVVYKINNFRQLEAGMKVKILGVPRLYKKSGKFSLFAEEIVPSGEGALRLAFEKLKKQLESEGLFDDARKRQLPDYPQTIGLITADGSRAYSDFIKVLQHRLGGLTIYFYPVKVQGSGSAESVCEAIRHFNKAVPAAELLVITRGGGSLEELAAFNDERVARAVFGSTIPVVSAVGHEKDVSLCDLVADFRASTPSNAAELVVKSRVDVSQIIRHRISRLDQTITSQIFQKSARLQQLVSALDTLYRRQTEVFRAIMKRLERAIDTAKSEIEKNHLIINQKTQYLFAWEEALIASTKNSVTHLSRLLASLDYSNVLKRGFSISLNQNNKIIKRPAQVVAEEQMTTVTYGGKIYSHIISKE